MSEANATEDKKEKWEPRNDDSDEELPPENEGANTDEEETTQEKTHEKPPQGEGMDIAAARLKALDESLSDIKLVQSKEKSRFYEAALDYTAASASLLVKVSWAAAAIVALSLGIVLYYLLRAQTSDEALEKTIKTGDHFEVFKAIMDRSMLNVFHIFAIVVGFFLLVIFAGFGVMIFYKDSTQYQLDKRGAMVCAAEKTFGQSDNVTTQLTSALHSEIQKVGNLQHQVEEYTNEIVKLSKEGEKYKSRIEELKDLKEKAVKDLAFARGSKEKMEENLKDAKQREKDMKEDLRNKEKDVRLGREEAAKARGESSWLRTELQSSKSDAATLRIRSELLQKSDEERRSQAEHLKIENARLAEAAKHAKRSFISINF